MSFEFDTVERFICGTVGQPGEREFYLQIRSGSRLISAVLEKAQASALAARLDILLKQILSQDIALRIDKAERDDAPLEQPIDQEFTIGAISIAYDDQGQRICIELFSIKDSDEDDETPDVTLNVTLSQTKAFVARTMAVVNAGRLPCPFCSIPIDPQGHLCPRANGYRR